MSAKPQVNLFFLKDLLLRDIDAGSDGPNGNQYSMGCALQEKFDAVQKLKNNAHFPAFLQVMKSMLMSFDFFRIKEKAVQMELLATI